MSNKNTVQQSVQSVTEAKRMSWHAAQLMVDLIVLIFNIEIRVVAAVEERVDLHKFLEHFKSFGG